MGPELLIARLECLDFGTSEFPDDTCFNHIALAQLVLLAAQGPGHRRDGERKAHRRSAIVHIDVRAIVKRIIVSPFAVLDYFSSVKAALLVSSHPMSVHKAEVAMQTSVQPDGPKAGRRLTDTSRVRFSAAHGWLGSLEDRYL